RADLDRIRPVRALERRSGGPAPMLDVEIARGAYDLAAPERDERHAVAVVSIPQRRSDVALRLLDAIGHARVDVMLPRLRSGRGEAGRIRDCERAQGDRRALEDRLVHVALPSSSKIGRVRSGAPSAAAGIVPVRLAPIRA